MKTKQNIYPLILLAVVIGFLVIIYLAFSDKSEFVYALIITIVISGGAEHFWRPFSKFLQRRRKEKNPLID